MADCSTAAANLGFQCQKPKGIIKGVLISKTPFSGTLVEVLTKTFWQTLFQKNGNDRVFYVPAEQVVPANDEQQFEELDGGITSPLGWKSGKDIFKISNPSDPFSRNINTWNNAKVYYAYVYANGFIDGKITDGANFEQKIGKIYVDSEKVTNTTSPKIVFSMQQGQSDVQNSKNFQASINQDDTDFIISEDFYAVQSAVISVNDALSTSSNIVFSYKTEEGIDIKGLIKADVTVKNSSGVAQTINTLAETSNLGLQYYTANFSTPLVAGTYTVNTVDAETMSIKGFETLVSDTYVVPA